MSSEPPRVAPTRIWQAGSLGEAIRGPFVEPLPEAICEDLTVGHLEAGTVEARYRGERHLLHQGSLILCQPGETVAFAPTGDTPAVRICFNSTDAGLQTLVDELHGRPCSTPYLPGFIYTDPELVGLFVGLQRSLQRRAPLLECASRYHEMLVNIAQRHLGNEHLLPAVRSERMAVRHVREYLDAHYPEKISLADLATLAGLSTFHLNRAFRTEVGLPPYAYQMQRRIARSKALIATGAPIGYIAHEVGFYDQSHFTNHFRRWLGYSPAFYRDQIISTSNRQKDDHENS